MEPVLKWAGGKRKLLPYIKELLKGRINKDTTFFEPFVGGGALFLDLELTNVCINDLNSELINVYETIKTDPEKLIAFLKKHKLNHNHDYFYKIRNEDRNANFKKCGNARRAARTIYLNRVCYNGLYRVNSKGQFNVPIGRYVNPQIVLAERIKEISIYLNTNNVQITNLDFEKAIEHAKKGDIVYFDPPYDFDKNGFINYTQNGFSRDDLKRLKNVCDDLIKKGVFVVISNNDTAYVNKLFSNNKYCSKHIETRWTIGRNKNSRKIKREVIIYG